MKKTTLNFIINALMFVFMSIIAGIGFLIKYTLISGQERWTLYGENVALSFMGMDRHEWGDIHLIFGYILLVLLIIHIILHWNAITCICNRIFQKKQINTLVKILFITICTMFIVVPFIVKPEISKIGHGEGRHVANYNNRNEIENTNKKEELENINNTGIQEHPNPLIEIRGYMTLAEISEKYNIPTEFIKVKLNVPKSVPDKQKLSWLRNKYNVKMNDVEKIIIDYQKNK